MAAYEAFFTKQFMSYLRARASIERLFELTPPQAVLGLGEGYALSILGGQAGVKYQAPWLSWTIVMASYIDTLYFPAEYHLFYGSHGKDIYLYSGGDCATAATIGSPLYDSAKLRSKEHDLAYVKELLPNWRAQKLVVIGTENRPGQQDEIRDLLRVLKLRGDVYCVLKLHPFDSEGEFRNLLNEYNLCSQRCSVVTSCDLDALLHVATCLFTMFSNIIINADLLGIPVLVHDPCGVRAVDFPNLGIGLLSNTCEELQKNVDTVLCGQRHSALFGAPPFGGIAGRSVLSSVEAVRVLRQLINTGVFDDDALC